MMGMERLRKNKYENRIGNYLNRLNINWESEQYSDPYPINIEIHPTDICNLTCGFCAYQNNRTKQSIEENVFKSIAADITMSKKVVSVLISGGGEPTCNPNTKEFINHLVDGNVDVAIITNGFFNDCEIASISRCSFIRFSINTYDEMEYCKITQSSSNVFKNVCSNIRTIAKSVDRRSVGISSVIFQGNDDIAFFIKFIEFASSLGVGFIDFRPLSGNWFKESLKSFEQYTKWITPIERKAMELGIKTNYTDFIYQKFALHTREYLFCPVILNGIILFIDASAKVYPCIGLSKNSLEGRYLIGDVNCDSLDSILNSTKRKLLISSISVFDCPICCRHDHMNKIIINYFSKNQDIPIMKDYHWKQI